MCHMHLLTTCIPPARQPCQGLLSGSKDLKGCRGAAPGTDRMPFLTSVAYANIMFGMYLLSSAPPAGILQGVM